MSPPPELQQLALKFSGDLFLIVTLQNNNRHTSARAQKIFPYVTYETPDHTWAPTPTGHYGEGVFPPAVHVSEFLQLKSLTTISETKKEQFSCQ